MIKKLNIHFRSALREKLEKEEEFKYCAGFRQALAFPNHILMFCMDEWRAIKVHMNHNTIKGLEGLLQGNGAESHWLADAFRKSNRMQAVISLAPCNSVRTEILFYGNGEEEELFSLYVDFTHDDGHALGSGMRE